MGLVHWITLPYRHTPYDLSRTGSISIQIVLSLLSGGPVTHYAIGDGESSKERDAETVTMTKARGDEEEEQKRPDREGRETVWLSSARTRGHHLPPHSSTRRDHSQPSSARHMPSPFSSLPPSPCSAGLAATSPSSPHVRLLVTTGLLRSVSFNLINFHLSIMT